MLYFVLVRFIIDLQRLVFHYLKKSQNSQKKFIIFEGIIVIMYAIIDYLIFNENLFSTIFVNLSVRRFLELGN